MDCLEPLALCGRGEAFSIHVTDNKLIIMGLASVYSDGSRSKVDNSHLRMGRTFVVGSV